MDRENDQDRANQVAVAIELCKRWNLSDIRIFPTKSVLDYLMMDRHGAMVWGELKCRDKHRSLHYPTLMISKSKLDRAIGVADETCLEFVLIIRWSDGIFWQSLTRADLKSFRQGMGGREDRDDPNDMEMMYFIPSPSFKPLRRV